MSSCVLCLEYRRNLLYKANPIIQAYEHDHLINIFVLIEIIILILVKKVEEGTYLCGALNENIKYDFCMCNPPFFGDDRESKRRHELCSEPRNAPSGTNVELATKGGEISFVKTIIDDSTKVFNSIRFYFFIL